MTLTMNSPAAIAVRDRKDYFSKQLVRAVARNPSARILVLACGHFREGDIIIGNEAFDDVKVTCLDQDSASCAEVERRFGKSGVTAVNNKVSVVLRFTDTKYDLIYAAGLYDYLKDDFAVKLNAHLISILATEGRLVVPNFLQSAPNRASMELLQDWFLIYRDPDEIRHLISNTGGGIQLYYFEDDHNSIGYAVLDR